MKSNKAISMISLVITILIIIILASISSFYLSSVIDDAQYKDAKEELKNVENVVEYAKTQILIDEFVPNSSFLIKDDELESKFGRILSDKEKEQIKKINNSENMEPPYKYYLMNQEKFDSEFGNDYNVSNLRPAREYLVNYMDTLVISSYSDERVATSPDIVTPEEPVRAELAVKFTPNGNIEWAKQQATIVSIESNEAAIISSTKYLWSQSNAEPSDSEFVNSLYNGQEVVLKEKTGNDWYLWVYITYKENGVEKSHKYRSEPFYLDNSAPTGKLVVESINK